MNSCCCGGVEAKSEKSEKDLIDLEKYGIVCETYGFIYLLKGNTLCAIYRSYKEKEVSYNDYKITYMMKLFYSITTISSPTTLNITGYTLDEEKSYIDFTSDSMDYINTMEGCVAENRKYKINEIQNSCYFIQYVNSSAMSYLSLPVYFDSERFYAQSRYGDVDIRDYYSKNSIDDITYKINSELYIYQPKPSQILFYSCSWSGEFFKYYNHWFHTPHSNGYIQQSIDNDTYEFVINEDVELTIKTSDSYDILVYPKSENYNGVVYVKLNKDDDRICYSTLGDDMNDIWSDFYVNECVYTMSKTELIEKFKSVYNQLSTSFDDNYDKIITSSKRSLMGNSKEMMEKKEFANKECYYIENLENEFYEKYEGYFVNENAFTLIFTYYGSNRQQFKIIIPFTDPSSISLKNMNCKESQIEIFYNESRMSFEEYYGNCDIDNNQKLKSDINHYLNMGNFSFSSDDKTITYKEYGTRRISLKNTTCEIFDVTVPKITVLFPPIPKDKTILETYGNRNYLYSNGKCFNYNENSAEINCRDILNNHMVEGIDDKYFKGLVEFFNLSGYDFESDTSTVIKDVKSKYISSRENNYNKILELINNVKEMDDEDDKNEDIEFNTKDNYDELYKGNGVTDGRSVLISNDKILLFPYGGNNYRIVYSYTSTKEGEKTIIKLGDIDEDKSYITIYSSDEITCQIDPGIYSCKNIKEKCPDEYQTIFEDKKRDIKIPSYIENNRLYYENLYSEDYSLYEISNADIHYKIDHPRIKDYPIKQYEIWSWHKAEFELGKGYILQTNSSIFEVILLNGGFEKIYGYVLYNYSFNPIEGSIKYKLEKISFFHLVENDSRICYEGVKDYTFFDNEYLINECYKVTKPDEVIEQFKADYPALAQRTKTEIEDQLNSITNGEVKSIEENKRIESMKLRKEEGKGYYYEYYCSDYNEDYDNNDERYNHYRGYFITSNQFTIIYQYEKSNSYTKDRRYQIKLVYDISKKQSLNINDFDCELSEIELPCSGDEDCPNSKKTFKEQFDSCNNKEEIDVYLNDLVDANIDINIDNKRINITKNENVFLIIPLQERELSKLQDEMSIITKNTRGVSLDKSYDTYLKKEKENLIYNLLKINEGMIMLINGSDPSFKGIEIIFIQNATEMINVGYFDSYHDFDFHVYTLPNTDYCMTFEHVYHNWINQGRYPFISEFGEIKQKLLSNLDIQFNKVLEDVLNSMKNEPSKDTTESPSVTIKPTGGLEDEGSIIEISMALLICMIMVILI